MRPNNLRRVTLIDAMVLVAATAVALLPIRLVYPSFLIEAFPIEWAPESVWSIALAWNWILGPFTVAWSIALWVLRLLQPRPSLRRVFRQPGMAASTAVVLSVLLFAIKLLVIFGFSALTETAVPGGLSNLFADGVIFAYAKADFAVVSGDVVLAVWLVLWLGRACARGELD